MRSRRSRPALRGAASLAILATVATVAPARSRGAPAPVVASEVARRIEASVVGLDFDQARRELSVAQAVTDDPRIGLERARLDLYELDCDAAAAIVARPEVEHMEDGETIADASRGCQRVIAALAVSKDDVRGIEVRWQDENDAPLAQLLFDTVAKAREALSRDLGVDWPLPTRIVVVRDLLSLSAMTGLPYESARTTGTVAVAKWGRVTLLSPRASPHGFAWLDTVAHELTHLAVTRATGDRAPLWLQEGIAKRQETRWRAPGPFDDRPAADVIARDGFDRGLGIALDKLGPSIAMLPTADAARVAFAEVTSFVGFYLQEQGADGLAKLLRQLHDGKNPDAALFAASGAGFKTWETRWRAFLASRPRTALPALLALGDGGPKDDRPSAVSLRELRDRSRLAELLLARDHPPEAITELDRVDGRTGPGPSGAPDASGASGETGNGSGAASLGAADASIAWLHGRALEMLGRLSEVGPLVSDPAHVASSYGPWWALRGRWARGLGDQSTASDSFSEGLAVDPLDPEVACVEADTPAPLPASFAPSLCDAAKKRDCPPFGGD